MTGKIMKYDNIVRSPVPLSLVADQVAESDMTVSNKACQVIVVAPRMLPISWTSRLAR